MRVDQIELWTLKILDRVTGGGPVEDVRVELKREWIDPIKAARRVGGHANALRGDSVLWIIGADENAHSVPGCKEQELSTWWPQVKACFEGISPTITEVVVDYRGVTVMALLFDTARRPFVVKNPNYGSSGHTIQYEVPWRDGTSVRSAHREDLIRILVPQSDVPDLAVLNATATFALNDPDKVIPDAITGQTHYSWRLNLDLYVTPQAAQRVVVPKHLSELHIQFDDLEPFTPFRWKFRTPSIGDGFAYWKEDSVFIQTTSADVIISGPGRFFIDGDHFYLPGTLEYPNVITVQFTMSPAGSTETQTISVKMLPGTGDAISEWTMVAQ